mmetsp:Transcript_9151/g.14194  ORF Transcript_9151/g.14194 Transcript_9151/m.14194 type:complete len:319 (-) Transcript_9151:119-1075(-)|eukprot:CAMPEP_0194221034 /NCGR_PEP_ID=MMETSP0156-20130528/29755_1 /TAXON_ID=33649 /ORGANISM="Thalassionema nitzschioides, Strain L26-B" /LENGTH=318 /DNA_ID=CAMNT_0038951309 /DNA_START=242 /DNA_END=1198 /DNA_ORIENTATION=-
MKSYNLLSFLLWSVTSMGVECFQTPHSSHYRSDTFQWALESHREASLSRCRRISIAGVSVSPQGFWAFLRIPGQGYWPIQITHNPQDSDSSTSPESLTLLQLISGVDMAGAVLPPDILAKLVVLHAESQPTALRSQDILKLLELPEGVDNYSETNQWQRSRVNLPQVTLDELTLHPLRLDVTVKGLGPLSFSPSESHLKQVCWSYDEASREFISLALALRYKAPIIVQEELPSKPMEKVEDQFPMYSTVETLQKTSKRVTKNIERGFEIHKLSGALRLAIEKGDTAAAAKIQNVLDELESMDDLPTLEEDKSKLDEME